jgi:hypothetical protein
MWFRRFLSFLLCLAVQLGRRLPSSVSVSVSVSSWLSELEELQRSLLLELLELDELSFLFFFLFSPVVSLPRFFCRRSRPRLDSLLELADRLEPLRDRLRFRLFLFLSPPVRDLPWSRFLRKFCC